MLVLIGLWLKIIKGNPEITDVVVVDDVVGVAVVVVTVGWKVEKVSMNHFNQWMDPVS